MKIELLFFPGCPHVAAARDALRQALAGAGLPLQFDEIDVTDAGAPERLRNWGSPTILIDGIDVAGGAPGGVSCRLYPESDSPGAPSVALIQAALRARM